MIIKKHHSWNLNYKNAVEIQKKLAKKIILYDDINPVKRIAGVDVKFLKNSNLILGAVLIFSFPDLTLIEAKTCKSKTDFPYIPGYWYLGRVQLLRNVLERLKIFLI